MNHPIFYHSGPEFGGLCTERQHPDGWVEVVRGKRVFRSLKGKTQLWKKEAGELAGKCLLSNAEDYDLENLTEPVVIEAGELWKVVPIDK